MRVLGLDVGKKRIGISVSDELFITAQPLEVLNRTSLKNDLHSIIETATSYSASEIVVGLPISMNGSESAQTRYVLKFIEKLKKKITEETQDIKISTWDERLSTAAVERVLIKGDVSRKGRKKVVDKLAASYILQGYLDSKKTINE